jgi:hypothetical protein
LEKPRCSKEIADKMGNPHNDRNIQKYLNKLAEFEFLKFVGIGKNIGKEKYPKSKFFMTNNNLEITKIESLKDIFTESHNNQSGKTSIYLIRDLALKSKNGPWLIPLSYEKLGEIEGD